MEAGQVPPSRQGPAPPLPPCVRDVGPPLAPPPPATLGFVPGRVCVLLREARAGAAWPGRGTWPGRAGGEGSRLQTEQERGGAGLRGLWGWVRRPAPGAACRWTSAVGCRCQWARGPEASRALQAARPWLLPLSCRAGRRWLGSRSRTLLVCSRCWWTGPACRRAGPMMSGGPMLGSVPAGPQPCPVRFGVFSLLGAACTLPLSVLGRTHS